MMKCDVCQTTIPHGEDTCPNCGYIVKKKHVSSFDVSGSTHEHIQVSQKVNHKQITKGTKKINIKPEGLLIKVGIIVIVLVVVVGYAFFAQRRGERYPEYVNYHDMTFAEMIEKGYEDDYGTLAKAQETSKELIQFFQEQEFKDVKSFDYGASYGDIFMPRVTVEGTKEGITYSASISMKSQQGIIDTGITVTYYSDISMKEKMMTDKNVIDILSDYLELSNVYETWNEGRTQIVKDEEITDDDVYVYYMDNDQSSVYMSEQQLEEEYFHYMTITQYH